MNEFFSTFILGVCTIPDYYEFCIKSGLNLTEIPACTNRHILDEFIKNYNEKGFDYAKFEARRAGVGDGFDLAVIPFEEKNIVRVFKEKIFEARAVNLAKNILTDPTKTQHFIDSYLENKPQQYDLTSMHDLAEQTILNHALRASGKKQDVYIKGFGLLSSMIGGFNPGRVTIISASSGFGKTTLSINLSTQSAETMKVGIINMEMILEDMVDRILQSEIGSTITDLVSKNHNKVINFFSSEKSKNIFVTDGRSMSLNEIDIAITALKQKHNCEIVFVDYDQKIEIQMDSKTPEWKALQNALHGLESVAKRLKIHIVVLSQANDEGTPSGSKRSIYPVSTSLWFHKEDEKYLLTPIKNRFGPTNKSIEVEYLTNQSKIKEIGYYERNRNKSLIDRLRQPPAKTNYY